MPKLSKKLVGPSDRTYLYYICNNKDCSCYCERILQEKLTESLLPLLVDLSKQFFEKSKKLIAKNQKIDLARKELDLNIKKLTVQLEKAHRLLLDETLTKTGYQPLKKKLQHEIEYYKNEKSCNTKALQLLQNLIRLHQNKWSHLLESICQSGIFVW